MKNYYKVLGLNQDASSEEIERAYNILSRKYDPNKNTGDRHIEEKFIDISIAYKTLKDYDKRKDYDRILISLSLDADVDDQDVPGRKQTAQKGTQRKRTWFLYFVLLLLLLGAGFALKHKIFPLDNTVISDSTAHDSVSGPHDTAVTPPVSNVHKTTIKKPELPPDNKAKTPRDAFDSHTDKHTNKKRQDSLKAVVPDDNITKNSTDYTIGATKNMVLAIQGTPTTITKISETAETWNYGRSTLYFEDNKLKSYTNQDNNLLLKR